ncbi:acyl-CoA synthetase FdrA [Salmonella enterica]|nr:acyl-CoA synthetase FdrA [Salmonella enterica]
MIHAFIKKGCFQDSVSLMIISRKLSESENVDDVSVMMGTPANKSLLETTGFWHDDFHGATPNDICVAIRTEAVDDGITQVIVRQLEEALQQLAQGSSGSQSLIQVRRWESACQKLPEANLALVSVAGEYAAELAEQALDRSLNVMIFSDNVTLDDEIRLKRRARDKGLLVMGPDCGTAMIANTPLAFANVMPEGNIGVIGASGTGIQELCSQIALAGEGITHAIGLGGRDLSAEVGGISALTALEILSADEKSQVLAFVSKPPADAVRHQIIDLGDDFYTVGRPHPMIDPALRNQLIAGLGAQPQVRVLLVDVVIGFGATADPAASLIQAWQKACAARAGDQPLFAIATVTGTERDPQCRSQQIAALEDAGITVVDSLPEATLLAAELIRPTLSSTHPSAPRLLEAVAVINAGLRSFALDLQAAGMPVVHYQWAPVAGGNKKLARLLERLQ